MCDDGNRCQLKTKKNTKRPIKFLNPFLKPAITKNVVSCCFSCKLPVKKNLNYLNYTLSSYQVIINLNYKILLFGI